MERRSQGSRCIFALRMARHWCEGMKPGCCCTLWSPWLSPALWGRGAPRLVKTTTSSFCVPGGMLTAWGPWTVCVATMPPAWAIGSGHCLAAPWPTSRTVGSCSPHTAAPWVLAGILSEPMTHSRQVRLELQCCPPEAACAGLMRTADHTSEPVLSRPASQAMHSVRTRSPSV